MKNFSCQCGNVLFFENTTCLQCFTPVGFDPVSLTMEPTGDGSKFKLCANSMEHAVCNWLIPKDDPNAFCQSCRLNAIIPNLGTVESLVLWAKMEAAKRRALFSLLSLGLPLQPLASSGNLGATDENGNPSPLGLSFKFMEPFPDAPVLTGHDAGTITLNLEEANDAIRERNRLHLHEPYRTLLGHFRHELGHYYWSMWFENDKTREEVLPACRDLFGDDSFAYSEAMKTYYANGPLANWQNTFISAYSTMHPWEDWAETWAHYLHITDGLETFESLGLRKSNIKGMNLTTSLDLSLPKPFHKVNPKPFLKKLHEWIEITPAINELSSSLGQNMPYPFVLSQPVMRKLFFMHCMIERQAAAVLREANTQGKGERRKTAATTSGRHWWQPWKRAA